MTGKIILDLCGGTGSWSAPYREAGYDVRLVTLPENDVTTYRPPKNVFGILAAPPCTVFSLAAWKIPMADKKFAEGMEVVSACMKIIWECQQRGGQLKFWAMENPVGHLRKFMGKPAFTFQGWQFGEFNRLYGTKRTDLWGHFSQPRIRFRQRPLLLLPPTRTSSAEWYSPKHLGFAGHEKLTRTEIRAITPPGFARAFFEANP